MDSTPGHELTTPPNVRVRKGKQKEISEITVHHDFSALAEKSAENRTFRETVTNYLQLVCSNIQTPRNNDILHRLDDLMEAFTEPATVNWASATGTYLLHLTK
jgi:hypothetical protein